MSKFKVGDWVYAFQKGWDDNWYTEIFKDNPGQIKYINSYGNYAIEFERPYKYFHNCEGHCKDGHGHWIWKEKYLTKINKKLNTQRLKTKYILKIQPSIHLKLKNNSRKYKLKINKNIKNKDML